MKDTDVERLEAAARMVMVPEPERETPAPWSWSLAALVPTARRRQRNAAWDGGADCSAGQQSGDSVRRAGDLRTLLLG